MNLANRLPFAQLLSGRSREPAVGPTLDSLTGLRVGVAAVTSMSTAEVIFMKKTVTECLNFSFHYKPYFPEKESQ